MDEKKEHTSTPKKYENSKTRLRFIIFNIIQLCKDYLYRTLWKYEERRHDCYLTLTTLYLNPSSLPYIIYSM